MKRENDKSGPSRALYNWYPGHMAKALREVKQRLKLVDIVLEVRDARAPIASGNKDLSVGLGNKPRLILLNKANLIHQSSIEQWSNWFETQDTPFLFLDCFDKSELKKCLSLSRRIVEINRKKTNPDYTGSNEKLKIMIVGLPNTGKSTIINQLCNKNMTKVADKPGLTQNQIWIKIDDNIDLLDTPGIMPPMVEREDHGLWLSAIHAIPDDIAGEEKIAIFLVQHLLKDKSQSFLERYKLDSFDQPIDDVLHKIAVSRGCLRQKGLPDLERVYKLLLLDFRRGELGKTCFSLPPK